MSAKECLDRIRELESIIYKKTHDLYKEISDLKDLIYDDLCAVCGLSLEEGFEQCESCGNVICTFNECGDYDSTGDVLLCRDCIDSLLIANKETI